MKKPNRLINETSPYLLQHAYNPVDWYPWGEEAFEKAKKEDKVIFLSIGYSTCHWCHVMEKESFENIEIANLLNQYFVPIKVDREELPEVDSIYMTALQMMGQQGGWPLNMFLTPDLKPFTGGTYFPIERRWGMPSFKEVLLYVLELWQTKKKEVIQISEKITSFLNSKKFSLENSKNSEIQLEHFNEIINFFYKDYDVNKGGFLLHQRNKFPPSLNLLLLIAFYRKWKNPICLEMIENTIKNIRKGGIYDQIGGGISRYATDSNWLIPHFEKMLYDNALFANVNIEMYKLTNDELYKNIAKDILKYIFLKLRHEEGGFYSAEDADSEGQEGKFYVWEKGEIISILEKHGFKKEEIDFVINYFGVTSSGNFEDKNVLFINQKEIRDEPFIEKIRNILYSEREKRIQPFRDEKILTSWNALMISTLCNAYLAFHDSYYLEESLKTFEFIKNYLTDTKDFGKISQKGFLKRSYNPKKKQIFSLPANLTDYALLGCSFLDLYKSTAEESFIIYANQIRSYILSHFYKDGVFYETEEEIKNLIIRPFDFYDGVIPSGVSAALRLLLQLSNFGYNHEDQKIVEETIKNFYDITIQNPFAYSYFLLQVFQSFFINQQIVIYFNKKEKLNELIHFFGKNTFLESSVLYDFPNSSLKIKWLNKKEFPNSDYLIYICKNFSCNLPISDIEKIKNNSFF
ncbi:MAG: thioredoxin domain-containing protein [Leptonema sp. (in: bacteria)]